MTDMTSPFGAHRLKSWEKMLVKQAQRLPVTWTGRRLALIFRRFVLLRGQKIIDATVDGLRLRLYMRDNVSERKFLFMPQFFDDQERKLLKRVLTEGSAFVDIGANAGIYAMTAAELVGDSGRVLAIEPNPVVLTRLRFNATLNSFETRVLVEQAAVSDKSETLELALDESNLGGSSLVRAHGGEAIRVECYPLFDLVKKHGLKHITVLKIDIEGAEDKAIIPFLESAPSSLHPEYIILENAPQDWRRDLPGALVNAGYHLRQTTRMNMIWEKHA